MVAYSINPAATLVWQCPFVPDRQELLCAVPGLGGVRSPFASRPFVDISLSVIAAASAAPEPALRSA